MSHKNSDILTECISLKKDKKLKFQILLTVMFQHELSVKMGEMTNLLLNFFLQ